MTKNENGFYLGNIWGRKWTVISAIIILVVLGIATCRYMMIKPDQLFVPEEMDEIQNANDAIQ